MRYLKAFEDDDEDDCYPSNVNKLGVEVNE
jgi:hypothetical protein